MRKDPVEWILRGLYSVVLYILLPITVYHLVWRGFRVREYFRRWDERYASYPQPTGQPRVWLHAVSVGEVNAAAPLVNALRQQRPDIRWVITTITPTGSERVRALGRRPGPSTCRTTCRAASTASSAISSPAWR
jgi:3-deoxy-D-manno-octulosonic-acid transferase